MAKTTNLELDKMNILTLNLKQVYFDQILSGEKTQEFRDLTPTTWAKYMELVDEQGNVYKDWEQVPQDVDASKVGCFAREYDAIKFLTGAYNVKPRPYMIVEVLGGEVFGHVDDDDEPIWIEYDGEKYQEAHIVYNLGKILEKSGC